MPFAVDTVDATAAGDVFSGALAAALGNGKPLADALVFASAAAALSTTKPGAQTSIPDGPRSRRCWRDRGDVPPRGPEAGRPQGFGPLPALPGSRGASAPR